MSRAGGMSLKDNLNRGRGELKPITPKVGDEDFYMTPRLKEDLEGVILSIKNRDKFGKVMGNRNHLLLGPPGVGKTLGVMYIATQLNFPVYDGKNIGTADAIKQTFEQLREAAKGNNPLILMINEVDKFSSRDDMVDPMQKERLNQLLDEMDGVESNEGIYIIGTTNKPDCLDIALRRPKRFGKEIEFMAPDRLGRLKILAMHANGKGDHKFRVAPDLLAHAATVSYGYTGADLVGLLNESFTRAVVINEKDKDSRLEEKQFLRIKQEDIDYARKKIKPTAIRDMPFREPQRKFSDIGGYSSHKDILRRIAGGGKGATILFYGPSGTGKTDCAEALAGEFGYNYMFVGGSEPEDKFVGETGKKIDKILDRAKQLAPCVLTFDEIDSLVEKRGVISHKSDGTGLLQSKLSRPIEGVFIIGTVNRPDLLGKAFIQRFTHRLYFGMPSVDEQKEIWRTYLPENLRDCVDEIIAVNEGLSGRDIANAIRIARDYGAEPGIEIYKHLVKNIRHDVEGYEGIIGSIGDAVRDYEDIRGFLNKGLEAKA